MNKLAIPISTKEEAMIAQKAGADRLELSIRALVGGLTPSNEQITDVLMNTSLPCYVLIRPNLNTYNLTDDEFKKLLHIMDLLKLTSVKGISIGVLKDGKIDKEKLEIIIQNKGDLELVFNHAIDSVFNYEEELEYLIEHDGIDFIETTGSVETIVDGYTRLIPYLDRIRNKLIIARGLAANNINLLLQSGFTNIIYQCKSSLVIDVGRFGGDLLSYDKVVEFSKLIKGL